MLIRLIKDWEKPPTFARQTPNEDMVWGDFKFTFEEVEDCDGVIVFNRSPKDMRVRCRKGFCWLMAMEPPTIAHRWYKKGFSQYDKVITQFNRVNHPSATHTHGALPWHIGKSYTELKKLSAGKESKLDQVSAVASNLNWMKGHEARLKLLEYLKIQNLDLALFGRGINFVEDKFDALYPYKYSIAIENTFTDHYWTEKIADCYLSWTMPIYAGATNIEDYFPPESMIRINPFKPKEALQIIEKAVSEDRWKKNLEAIAEAREKVLGSYQFFPYITRLLLEAGIEEENTKEHYSLKRVVAPWEFDGGLSISRKLEYRLRKLLGFKPF